MKQYVIYTRVSTAEQAKSGLGLEAQERDIGLFLESHPHEILARFCDTGSGADDGRPEFVKALKLVRKTGAELLVSKLDRLSRDVAMIAGLIKDVDVRIATMPTADTFNIHIYAALAEQERKFISQRTKAALKAASARGVKLGGYREGAIEAANVVRSKRADDNSIRSYIVIEPYLRQGLSLRAIASKLNAAGLSTPTGKEWVAQSVKRVIDRADARAVGGENDEGE